MKCNTCDYNFARIETNYNGEDVDCKYQICVYEIKENRKKKHKCYNCAWGTWTGLNFKCGLPRCIPNLGNFNGVGKNG